MGWVWTAVLLWPLLAVPAAVMLGRVINLADRRDRGEPPGPARPRRLRRGPRSLP